MEHKDDIIVLIACSQISELEVIRVTKDEGLKAVYDYAADERFPKAQVNKGSHCVYNFFFGMEPLKFQLPHSEIDFLYDVDEGEKFPYPITVLLSGGDGIIKPYLVLNTIWKTDTIIQPLGPLQFNPNSIVP